VKPRRPLLVAGVAALVLGGAAGAIWLVAGQAASSARITAGRQIYAEHCASCHGAKLEGQPNWREPLPSGRMPAPPHDASGHAWHHADADIILIIKEGLGAIVPNYQSDMPAFGGVLTDEDIQAVLAYMKSTWPDRERKYQADRSEAAAARD
jgi:mono/diheme cytochrome c family protein